MDKTLVGAIVFLLFLQSMSFVFWEQYPSADMYYKWQITDEIVQNRAIPYEDLSASEPRKHVYPPLFDILTAQLMVLTGANYWLISAILSFIILPLYFILSFSILSFFTKNRSIKLLASLLFCTNPFLVFQYAPIHAGPTIGHLLSLTLVYAFLRHFRAKKDSMMLMAVVSAFLLLSHYRSFILTYAIIAAFLSFSCLKGRLKASEALPMGVPLVSSLLLALPWLISRPGSIFATRTVTNPNLPSAGFLGLPLVLFSGIALYAVIKRWRKDFGYRFLVFWTGVPVFIAISQFLLGSSTFFRNLEYGALPVIFVASSVLVKDLSRQKQAVRRASYVLLLAFVCLQAVSAFMLDPLIFPGEAEAFEWLRGQEKGVTIASFKHSYVIPKISQKQVVVGAFPESLPGSEEKLIDVHDFFTTCDFEKRRDILEKYGVRYLFYGIEEQAITSCPLQFDAFQSVYNKGGVEVFSIK